MAFTPTVGSQLPLASGTLSSCYQYQDHFAWPIPFESPRREYVQNDCRRVAWQHGIDIDDLLEWNPSLSIADDDCHLQPGYSYCVLKTKGSRKQTPPWHSVCVPKDALPVTEVLDGTDPDCNCFATVTGEDIMDNSGWTCSSLMQELGLPLENIIKYNSWISEADCDTSLHAGLAADGSRAVCIGKLGLPTPTSAVVSSTSAEPPICTFDLKKGEYVCPDPPSCIFDPEKGEYICPGATATQSSHPDEVEDNLELK